MKAIANCPTCGKVLIVNDIGDAFCRECKQRVTFCAAGFVIGTKPLEWTNEEWDEQSKEQAQDVFLTVAQMLAESQKRLQSLIK